MSLLFPNDGDVILVGYFKILRRHRHRFPPSWMPARQCFRPWHEVRWHQSIRRGWRWRLLRRGWPWLILGGGHSHCAIRSSHYGGIQWETWYELPTFARTSCSSSCSCGGLPGLWLKVLGVIRLGRLLINFSEKRRRSKSLSTANNEISLVLSAVLLLASILPLSRARRDLDSLSVGGVKPQKDFDFG